MSELRGSAEGGAQARVRLPLTADPVLRLPADIATRWHARVLDPATAAQVADQRPIRPTVYIADRLLVSGAATSFARSALDRVATDLHLILQPPAVLLRRSTEVRTAVLERTGGAPKTGDADVATVHRIEPVEGYAVTPDAWQLLQTYRATLAKDDPATGHVALDHLMTAANGPDIGGTPFVQGHGIGGAPFVQGHGYGSSLYGTPGWGGRQPVAWAGGSPARDPGFPGRRPVVVVLDTGLGAHEWFADSSARLESALLGIPVANPEITGVTGNPYEGELDADAGHGTFIAGLIRQKCPDADVRVYAIMGGDGVVAESNLLEVLTMLAVHQEAAVANGEASAIVDVVSLSLGYYHEQAADLAYDPLLLAPLQRLGRAGVTVVVAAGNDSTDRPMFPAAFTPWSGGPITAPDETCLPVISVGARNPNGTTALFSNCGGWVTCERTGAALVSSYPTTIDAAAQPTIRVGPDTTDAQGRPDPRTRETLDPDDFRGGYAVWSGTSFAGPVLAGELAAKLCAGCDAIDGESMLRRGWQSVRACVPELAR